VILKNLFVKKQETAKQERPFHTRATRVPLSQLHRISFRQTDPPLEPFALSNISASGVGFLRGSVQWPEVGSIIQGEFTISEQKFPIELKLVYVTQQAAGCQFQPPFVELAKAIANYLQVEIAALEMTCVPSHTLQEEPDGTPCWFYGENNSELYYVLNGETILRFHAVFFANYIEGGKGVPLKFGVVVNDHPEDKPAHKGASLIHWESHWNEERMDSAKRFLCHIQKLKKEHLDALLGLLGPHGRNPG